MLVRGACLSTSALAVVLNAVCTVSKLCVVSGEVSSAFTASKDVCVHSAFAGITPCTLIHTNTPSDGTSHESKSRACLASNQTSTTSTDFVVHVCKLIKMLQRLQMTSQPKMFISNPHFNIAIKAEV